MISSARLGDKHVCRLPGHGTTPIASASRNVNINSMSSGRVGNTCGCRAVITTGFPSIQVNGRPMAHLGSPTRHGGIVITVSGDGGGGVAMGTLVRPFTPKWGGTIGVYLMRSAGQTHSKRRLW